MAVVRTLTEREPSARISIH